MGLSRWFVLSFHSFTYAHSKTLAQIASSSSPLLQIPTLASCSFDEIVSCAAPGQVQFLQLYVNKERSITRKFVEHAESRGIKGLFITVDAPQLGRREKDMRMKFENEAPDEMGKDEKEGRVDRSQGAARAISVRSLSILKPVCEGERG